MPRKSILEMKLSKIYPLLLQKVERKGRLKEELDTVIEWLTGYDMKQVDPALIGTKVTTARQSCKGSASVSKGSHCGHGHRWPEYQGVNCPAAFSAVVLHFHHSWPAHNTST